MATKKAILKALYEGNITEIFPRTETDNVYVSGKESGGEPLCLTQHLDSLENRLGSKAAQTYVDTLKLAIKNESNTEYIILSDSTGSKEIAKVDASKFVKDGMLQSAVYDESTHKLTLTWNADSGKTQATVIDLTDLVDAYKGGEGISVTNGTIRVTSDVAMVGTSNDVSGDATLYGAKKYAEEKANAAKNAVIGNSSDDYAKNTIYGAKAYADDAVNAAIDDLGNLAYKDVVARTDLADAVRTELTSKSRIFYKNSAPTASELVANDLFVQII